MSNEIEILKVKLQLAQLENAHLKEKLGEKEVETPWLGDNLDPRFSETMHSLSESMEWDCDQAAAFCVELLQNLNHPAAGEVNFVLSLKGG